MDNSDDPAFESMLRATLLRAPSSHLDARVESLFATGETDQRRRLWLMPLAIAAGLAIVLAPAIWFTHRTGPPPVAQRIIPASHPIELSSTKPVRIELDTSQVFDDGLVTDSENTPYQQTRCRTVRHIWFVDPQSHSRLLVRVPTEQIFIQKVEAF
jgi:hypothetical protein